MSDDPGSGDYRSNRAALRRGTSWWRAIANVPLAAMKPGASHPATVVQAPPGRRQRQITTRAESRPHRKRRRADLEAYRDWALITIANHSLLVLFVAITVPALAEAILALLLGAGLAIGTITVLHDAGYSRFGKRYLPNMLATQSAVPIGLWVAQRTLKHQVHHRLPANYPTTAKPLGNGYDFARAAQA